jgi:hypothetical protein
LFGTAATRIIGHDPRAVADDNNVAYTVIMIRTQISLPQEEYDAAKREAARLGVSLAEFVRRALRELLPADDSRPWMHYAGMVESGDAASSQHVDDVVYAQKG